MRYFLPFLPFVACAARVFVSDADKERTRVPGTDRVECEKRRRFSDMHDMKERGDGYNDGSEEGSQPLVSFEGSIRGF